MLTKQEAQKLMKIKGEVRGAGFEVNCDFILQEKGKQGLKKFEDKMAELGFPLECKEIKPMDFYPLGLGAISILAIKEVFNFDEKDVEKMGASVVKFSLIMKVFMKYFGSLKLIAEQIPRMWQKHYTIGDLEMPEFSKEKKYVILRLKSFRAHPIYCHVFKGFFAKVTEMVVKSSVTCKETKCMFQGDEYHEYLLTW